MRTRKWYFVAATALFLLAARGLYADFRAGYYTPAGPETIHQTLPNMVSTDATYDAGQYPIYYPELATGDVRDDAVDAAAPCRGTHRLPQDRAQDHRRAVAAMD